MPCLCRPLQRPINGPYWIFGGKFESMLLETPSHFDGRHVAPFRLKKEGNCARLPHAVERAVRSQLVMRFNSGRSLLLGATVIGFVVAEGVPFADEYFNLLK